jgi:hypothetical protein
LGAELEVFTDSQDNSGPQGISDVVKPEIVDKIDGIAENAPLNIF